jgi:murein DD-endopeptidase MepM/ murein hydrolase activator NlpD
MRVTPRLSLVLACVCAVQAAGAASQAAEPPAWFQSRTQATYDDYGKVNWPGWENLPFRREFIYPMNRPIEPTSDFGPRNLRNPAASRWHPGLDLRAPMGTDVFAVFPGIVVATSDLRVAFPEELEWMQRNLARFERACGNFVIQGILPRWTGEAARRGAWTRADRERGWAPGDFEFGGFIQYCHLSRVHPAIVSFNWTIVDLDSRVGFSGDSGNSKGQPHLHIGLYLNPKLNPQLLPERLRSKLSGCMRSSKLEDMCLLDPELFITPRPRALR